MTFDISEPFERSQLVIKEELAKGKFGYIHNATYKNIPVVVKSARSEDKNEMLSREYKFLQSLQASNITGIPKVGFKFERKRKECFVMERLDTDLKTHVIKTKEKKLPLETTLTIAMQVLKILKSVHDHGIVHSDIKLENLMLRTKDQKTTVYLIDFGLSSSFRRKGSFFFNYLSFT